MKNHRGHAAGILLAGGRGKRARFPTNKVYLEVGGAPMITHSLQTLDRSAWVVKLVLVIRPEDRDIAERAVRGCGITTPWILVRGGNSRHQSEHRGLAALSGDIRGGAIDLVAIHDGARPFLSPTLLERLFRDTHRHGGSAPTLPVETPTYQTSESGYLQAAEEHAEKDGDGMVPTPRTRALSPHLAPAGPFSAYSEESRLHRAQTPQVFWAPQLWAAYQKAREAGFEGVDTAETVERFSDLRIKAVPGDPGNLKLTFPEDFEAVGLGAD